MEKVGNLVRILDIKHYRIKLPSERIRQSLLLAFCSLILYSHSFIRARPPMYSVHKCLWNKTTVELDGAPFCEAIAHKKIEGSCRIKRRACQDIMTMDEKYCEKSRTILVNSLCQVKKINNQMHFSCKIFLWGNFYGCIRTIWIYFIDEELHNLTAIKDIFKYATVCRKCSSEHVKTGPFSLCGPCRRTDEDSKK